MSENTKVDLKKILSISGHSGLFMFISQAKSGIIVESLSDQKRMCVSSSTKVSSLSDIAIYTDDKELALKDVLLKMKEKENGGKASISPKGTPEELKTYFAQVLSDYDRERVYVSHIKKMVEWYNLLQQSNMTDFADDDVEEAPAAEAPEAEKVEAATEKKAAPKKAKKEVAEQGEKEAKPAAKKTTKKKATEE